MDAQESVRIANNAIDLDGRKLVIDTMDEYGVEEALRLRESGLQTDVIAVGVGPARVEDVLRTALAMGADRAIHVETDTALDPIALSAVIAQIARNEAADLILCGGQQSDWDSQALGAATAERLGWPQTTWTRALQVEGTTVAGQHDTDEGVESFQVELPVIVTTQQGLNEPRYPTLPNIIKAKRKEIRKDALESYGVKPKVKTTGVAAQARQRLRKIMDGKDARAAATQLVHSLRNEAQVIP
jgi:electron transfer flavoprotein beta subunit